jgi:hypothetical protein
MQRDDSLWRWCLSNIGSGAHDGAGGPRLSSRSSPARKNNWTPWGISKQPENHPQESLSCPQNSDARTPLAKSPESHTAPVPSAAVPFEPTACGPATQGLSSTGASPLLKRSATPHGTARRGKTNRKCFSGERFLCAEWSREMTSKFCCHALNGGGVRLTHRQGTRGRSLFLSPCSKTSPVSGGRRETVLLAPELQRARIGS